MNSVNSDKSCIRAGKSLETPKTFQLTKESSVPPEEAECHFGFILDEKIVAIIGEKSLTVTPREQPRYRPDRKSKSFVFN